jgi:hypothetical protein
MADKVCLFSVGTLVSTPGALLALMEADVTPLSLVMRHVSGDFGDLCDEDRAANDLAVVEGTRVFSSYVVAPDTKVWVITEADRSVTTLLLPSEY